MEPKQVPSKAFALINASIALAIGSAIYLHQSNTLPEARHTNSLSPSSISLEQTVTNAISFEYARQNASVRQAYLNQVIEKKNMPYCSAVVYDHDGNSISNYFWNAISKLEPNKTTVLNLVKEQQVSIRKQQLHMQVPDILQLSGQGNKVPLFVSRRFFEDSSTTYLANEEVRNVIEGHEGRHTEQHALGLPYFSRERLISGIQSSNILPLVAFAITELDADGHALLSAVQGKHKVREAYVQGLQSRFMMGQKTLLAIDGNGKLSREESALFEGLLGYLYQYPELRDIQVPQSFYEQQQKAR